MSVWEQFEMGLIREEDIDASGTVRPSNARCEYLSKGSSITNDDLSSACVVCMCRKPGYALKPCWHLCLCDQCYQRGLCDGRCPICRTPSKGVQRVYLP